MSETVTESMIESREREPNVPAASLSLSAVHGRAQGLLLRMFADPRVLTKEESTDLVAALREAVAQQPRVSELRVLLGMALCVNLDAQNAMEELGEAVRLAPDSFIAHLKMGELWMRLRVMPKAEDHTRQAAALAENLAQAELARRQAAAIRTMKREGIARDGYRTPWLSLARVKQLWMRVRNKGLEPAPAQNEELDTVAAQ
ncbi:MAG TPA: hypothetical protein VNJ52_09945 [Patescibacteria group bacterium]|nr:hypothetical protein [Patescibacteria group bacterium]